jgi:hypothetical protein
MHCYADLLLLLQPAQQQALVSFLQPVVECDSQLLPR